MLPFLYPERDISQIDQLFPGGFMKSKKTLLFVDDETEILEILVDLFAEDEYSLYTATRADDALAIAEKHNIDFVLSDLKLPDASGDDLLWRIRKKNPDSICVLTSGYLDVKYGCIQENRHDGTFYLSKPWDLMTIRQLVSERLEQ
ncbi:MAG TPA: response regulator [bacterium]|nr:response regulator [bacterium]